MGRTDCIPDFIIACCVLHNICLLKNDDLTIVEENLIQDNNNNIEPLMDQGRNCRNAGQIKRNDICDYLEM